jgi:uncharacterized protein
MNAGDKKVLQRFRTLLEKKVRVRRLFLFGSRARGDSHAGSDMDVLVVLDNEPTAEARDYVSDGAWEAGYRKGIVLVPVVFSKDEWESGLERHSLLAKAVKAEGIPL